jgi:hypothetical protein
MRYEHSSNHITSRNQREKYAKSAASARRNFRWSLLVAMMFVTLFAYSVQDSPALRAVTRNNPSPTTARKHQEPPPKSQSEDAEKQQLMEELTRLQEKLSQGVQFPAPRTHSRLLPLVSPSSQFFAALPNYGEALHQASQIFHQQLQESPVLNDFWQKKVGMAGLIVDQAIEQTYQFLQFLGDEIVVSGTMKPSGGSFVIMAEARKPGLKAFIQQVVDQFGGKTRPPVRVYTPQQLALAKAQRTYKPFLILVRPDFVVASTDLATLKSFNAQLNRGGVRFASSPFGEKIAQQYQNGAGIVFGADLHQLLSLRPHQNEKNEATLQASGFADLKYLVGEAGFEGGTASSNLELSFLGPRKGIAGWLRTPAPLNGLDFMTPDAAYLIGLNLKNLGEVFDDIRNLAKISNPTADEGIAQTESQLKINLKQDLFSKFSGQLVAGVDGPILPVPAWKVVAQLTDANGLERTLKQLIALASAQQLQLFTVSQQLDDGQNYYTFHFSGEKNPLEIECAFADGFLVAGGSHKVVKEALQIRQNGNSLAKASEFQDLLPPEQGSVVSGILYQNLATMLAPIAQQMPPDQAELFRLIARYSKPTATTLFGSEDAIRMYGRSHGFNLTSALIGAIAIPNLMHSKAAGEQVAAASNVRTLSSAETSYQITYAHYAPDLATLGPSQPDGTCGGSGPSENHACLIDANLGCAGRWCHHSGFKFNITGACNGKICEDYVILAVPEDSDSSGKSFCSTSDGVVRSRPKAPIGPVSVSQCQSWDPI